MLEARLDYVLIDPPPLLPVTDAAVLSSVARGAVVVGSGVVRKEHLRRALEALQAVNGNTLGLVVNRIPQRDTHSYGNYRYEYSAESERERAKDRQRTKATVAH
jgi:Mrp family chromosome partitioning ATPase